MVSREKGDIPGRKEVEEALDEVEACLDRDEDGDISLSAKAALLTLRAATKPKVVSREELESALNVYHITGPHAPFILEEDVRRFLHRLGIEVEDKP